jgi:hypothetical protein
VKGAQSAEKLIGVPADQIIRMPKADAKLEELAPVFARLGRPAKWEDYQLKVPEGADDSFAKAAGPILHQIGLLPVQARALNEWWNGYMQNQLETMAGEKTQREQDEVNALHREWPGETYKQREELGRRAFREFGNMLGETEEERTTTMQKMEDTLGTARFLKFFARVGEKLGEPAFEIGTGPSREFGMTPGGAKAKQDQLMRDSEWVARWTKNGKGGAEDLELDRLIRIQNQGA